MKCKKTTIISLALVVFYLSLHSLRSTSFGYVLNYLYESSYSSDSKYNGAKQETTGDAPGECHLTSDTKWANIGIIPGLLHYKYSYPKRINIAYRVSGDMSDCQYLDLSRLELILKNGKKEDILPPDRPFRVHLKDHNNARGFRLYESGQLASMGERRGIPPGVEFRSSGQPPSKQVTLIAEGTLYWGTGESRPFRQVAVWQRVKEKRLKVFGSLR